tara:strand:- start:676 stop:4518 length:3843 start_codon:yes stop_codon:yes gene_type:complete
MSTNWKDIGKNSGNMSQHRNVAANKLNYENGKWDSIYDVSGIKTKGYTFDICGENIVVGIGTSKPFSRLSLGTDISSGIFDESNPGQLAAFALNEESNGNKFKGLVYNSDITSQRVDGNNAIKVGGVQIISSSRDFSMNDISNGTIIITEDNVTTIGGEARRGNEFGIASGNLPGTISHIAPSGVDRKIVLDVRGSMRTDGYINFFNKTNPGGFVPNSNDYNNHDDIPIGSLFLTNAGGDNTSAEGLYFKASDNTIQRVSGGGGGGGGGGTTDISNAFDSSFNDTLGRHFIIGKAIESSQSGTSGGVPTTFSGKTFNKSNYISNYPDGFNNTVTIRDGNLSVITPSGDKLKITNAANSQISANYTDQSGGIILIEKQLLIGGKKNAGAPGTSNRFGYAQIDSQTIDTAPLILAYNYTATKVVPKPDSATNAIILLDKEVDDDLAGDGTGGNVGATYDCANMIFMGSSILESIDTPNSLISNYNRTGNDTEIIDISGSNIVFGEKNKLKNSPFSIVFGRGNNVDNTNTTAAVLGTETWGKENFSMGTDNKLFNSKNSFVIGNNNLNYGNLNVIFGTGNIVGNTNASTSASSVNYITQKSFIQGNNNLIEAPFGTPVQHVFIAGKQNKLDLSSNTLPSQDNYAYTLLGCYAGISGEALDTSKVRFAFGTYDKWIENGGDTDGHGNVFTIDCSGNTHIYGNLVVDGSQVVLRTEVLDVSDNNINLNANSGSPEGGGITIIDTPNKGLHWKSQNGPTGEFTPGNQTTSNDYWDTLGSDISTNNIFGNSGNFLGDVNIDGKLSVAGLIDPTGLVLDKQTGDPAGAPTDTNKLTLFFEGANLKYKIGSGSALNVSTTGGGAGSGMTSWDASGVTGTTIIDAVDDTVFFTTDDTDILTTECAGTGSADRTVKYNFNPPANNHRVLAYTGSTPSVQWSEITTALIKDDAVTFDKLTNVDGNTVLVRDLGTNGAVSAKAVTNEQILIGNGAGFTAAALSGDVSMNNTGAVTIEADAVTYAKMQNVATANRVLGSTNAGGEITETQVQTAMIADDAVTLAKMAGLADGNFIIGNAGGNPTAVSMTGDATLSNTGELTIGNNKITKGMFNSDVISTSGGLGQDTGGALKVAAGGSVNNVLQVGQALSNNDIIQFDSGGQVKGIAMGSSSGNIVKVGASALSSGNLLKINTSGGVENAGAIGISNTNIVKINGTASNGQFARFTSSGLEGVNTLASQTVTVQSGIPTTANNGLNTGDVIVDTTGNDVYFKINSTTGYVKLSGTSFTASGSSS